MKLYNEDCLKILKDIESESVDCVVTDCPYRITGGGSNADTNVGGILDHRKTELSEKTNTEISFIPTVSTFHYAEC